MKKVKWYSDSGAHFETRCLRFLLIAQHINEQDTHASANNVPAHSKAGVLPQKRAQVHYRTASVEHNVLLQTTQTTFEETRCKTGCPRLRSHLL